MHYEYIDLHSLEHLNGMVVWVEGEVNIYEHTAHIHFIRDGDDNDITEFLNEATEEMLAERLLANARDDGLLKPFAYPDKVDGEL